MSNGVVRGLPLPDSFTTGNPPLHKHGGGNYFYRRNYDYYKGKSFRTIQEAMKTMFNRETGSGPKRAYYEYKSEWAVWFPKAAIIQNGLLTPPKDQTMLNVLSADETEIIEVYTDPGTPPRPKYPSIIFRCITFLKDGNGPYVFKGVYTRTFYSADCRSRLYTKIADTFNMEAVTGELEADE